MPAVRARIVITSVSMALASTLVVAAASRDGSPPPITATDPRPPAAGDEPRVEVTQTDQPDDPAAEESGPTSDTSPGPARPPTQVAGITPASGTTTKAEYGPVQLPATSPTPPPVTAPTYATDLRGRVVFDTENGAGSLLVDGTDPQPVVPCPGGVSDRTPAAADVSPDGRWLARYCTSPDTSGIPITKLDLVVQRTDGSEFRILKRVAANRTAPSWSPDGKRIAFVELNNITLFRLDGTIDRVIRFERPEGTWHGGFTRVSWSPDSTELLLENLYIIDVATGSIRLVQIDYSTQSTYRLATFSPDGKWIYLRRQFGSQFQPGASKLIRVSTETGDIEIVIDDLSVSNGDDFMQAVVFAPDGRVIFARQGVMWSMRPDGSDRRQIATGFYDDVVLSTSITN